VPGTEKSEENQHLGWAIGENLISGEGDGVDLTSPLYSAIASSGKPSYPIIPVAIAAPKSG